MRHDGDHQETEPHLTRACHPLQPAVGLACGKAVSGDQFSAANCLAQLTSTTQHYEIEQHNHQGNLHCAHSPTHKQCRDTETARSCTCKLCGLSNKGSRFLELCDCWGLLGSCASIPLGSCDTPNGQACGCAAESSLDPDPLEHLLHGPCFQEGDDCRLQVWGELLACGWAC